MLLQEVAPRNAGGWGSQTTGPQMIQTEFSSETIATLHQAILTMTMILVIGRIFQFQHSDQLFFKRHLFVVDAALGVKLVL